MREAIERTNGPVASGRPTFFSDHDTRELVAHPLEHLAESGSVTEPSGGTLPEGR
ncbi:MAG TPA: hypothetical protein VKT21_00225 [Thermoplasmata archaeon]|nr:hypothetical protein [Thermoplasmata archaeon]